MAPPNNAPAPTPENLWKQYELHVKLLTDYLKLVVEFNIFYYAVTGAIISYYFSKQELPLIKFALLFPVAMSLLFAVLFIFGGKRSIVSRGHTAWLAQQLGFQIVPEYYTLTLTLYISAILFILVALALLGVVIFAPYNIPIPPLPHPHLS